MNKFVANNRKNISVVLLALIAIGSVFSLLAVAMPYLALGALKFTDGAPDQVTFGDTLIGFALRLMPIVPFALFLGGASALLYPFVSKDKENRLFLYVWGGMLLILCAMSIYKALLQIFG